METVARVAFVYLLLMVTLRVVGKRELGRMSPFELILLLLIPELFSQAVLREDVSMTNAVIAFFALVSLVFLTSLLAHRFRALENLMSGTPTVLASNGRCSEEHMNVERVQPEDGYAELRKAGFENLSDAKWIVLEDDGKLSIVPINRGRINMSNDDGDMP